MAQHQITDAEYAVALAAGRWKGRANSGTGGSLRP